MNSNIIQLNTAFKVKGQQRRDELRKWFFNFHNFVNSAKTTPTTFQGTLDDLPAMYGTTASFITDKYTVIDQIKKGMSMQWVTREDMQRTSRTLEEFWICVGL